VTLPVVKLQQLRQNDQEVIVDKVKFFSQCRRFFDKILNASAVLTSFFRLEKVEVIWLPQHSENLEELVILANL
jgi:cystathionine beta-lyase/cystathionine gamma-synthase